MEHDNTITEEDTSQEFRFPTEGKVQLAHVSIGRRISFRTMEREFEGDFQILVNDNGVYVRIGNDESCLPEGG